MFFFQAFRIKAVYDTLKMESPESEHNSFWRWWEKFLNYVHYPPKYILEELSDSGFSVFFFHKRFARDINDTERSSKNLVIRVAQERRE